MMSNRRTILGHKRAASMGFRPTPEIRQKIEQAAGRNGRSMSQEIEHRLELSFWFDDLECLRERVESLERVIKELGPHAIISDLPSTGMATKAYKDFMRNLVMSGNGP